MPSYAQECLDHINGGDLDTPEEDEEDDKWRIRADVGKESGDFDGLLLHIWAFLPIRVDGDEELQGITEDILFCLAEFGSLLFGPRS
jgi:hypothetical protein